MLETESEAEGDGAGNEEQQDAGSNDRRRRCGGPGWRCGAGAFAGPGFGAGGGFGPFQFMGASPFGMPPHGHGGDHRGGGRGGRGGRGCHGRHGHHHGRHGGRHGHFGPPPFGPPHGPPPPFGPHPPHCHDEVPHVDVLKEEHQFTLIADLPGFTKKDVDVKVADSKLNIKGKLPERNAAEAEEIIGERHAFKSFDRTFRLWDDVDSAKITAKLEHGVLRIVMPRKEGPKPQDIPVDSSDDEFVAVDEDDGADGAGPSTA